MFPVRVVCMARGVNGQDWYFFKSALLFSTVCFFFSKKTGCRSSGSGYTKSTVVRQIMWDTHYIQFRAEVVDHFHRGQWEWE